MARLFKKSEEKKGIWKKVVDLAFTDVRVAVKGLDQNSLGEVEERLLAADFGVTATLELVDHLEDLTRRGRVRNQGQLQKALRDKIREILEPSDDAELTTAATPPTVYLVVGVNGTGKTTSIAKLGNRFVQTGHSVVLAAADTFRAGAVAQLGVWADRIGADFVGGESGGDPAAVAFDAIDAAEARGRDVVLVDTAGRLHTHKGLMEELVKIDRVIKKRIEGAPHETLIVLDATTGQNAVRQVEAFSNAVDLSGIVLAKLDSTAKGGIVLALQTEYGIPVKAVGTGEGIDDLQAFDATDFADAIVAAD